MSVGCAGVGGPGAGVGGVQGSVVDAGGVCVRPQRCQFGAVGVREVHWGALSCVFSSNQQVLHRTGMAKRATPNRMLCVLRCAAGAIEEEEDDEL